MCMSIVFGASLAEGCSGEFADRLAELGRVYEYGLGIGREELLPEAGFDIFSVLSEPDVVFEVHDLPEKHCACDIDDDIRIASKLGRKSKFFDLVREVLVNENVQALSVLFFQEILPSPDNVRKQLGSYEDFVTQLNRWNTWQVEGFEPTRQAYFISDGTPFLFTFTNENFSQ